MTEDAWWDGLGADFHTAVRSAEPRGRMSYRELDAVLPDGEATARQIERVLAYLRRRGIELYEDDGAAQRRSRLAR